MEQKKVITSLDLAKRGEILPGLRQVHWDLVIVDEATACLVAAGPQNRALCSGGTLKRHHRPFPDADGHPA